MFPVSVMIDLAIVAALVLCVFLGRRRGLFRSLLGLTAVVIAMLLASRLASLGADLVIDNVLRPAATAAMEQRVDELLAESTAALSPMEEMERVVSAIPNDFIREKAAGLLGRMELSTESTVTRSARETLLALGGSLLDTVLDTAVRGALYGAIYLVAFLVVTVALKLAARALDLTLKLPLLRQANQLGGLLFGAAEGVVLVCAAVGILGHMKLWVTPETIQASVLLKLVAQWVGLSAA